jgi:hypothetical protein
MSEQQVPQISKLMGELVAHQSGFNALSKSDRQFIVQDPKTAIAVMVSALRNRPKEPAPERAYKVLRPATPEIVEPRPFKADETFFNKNSDLKMVPHGDNFTKWFAGKVEDDVSDGELRVFALTQAAYDRDIIADLGGEEKAEITLGELWRFMRKHDRSASGWFLCYIRDNSGVLRTVYVDRNVDGWDACAYALGDYRWDDDRQVLSRNS